MFDLDAGIDLDKVKLSAVTIHQELDRTGVAVLGGFGQTQRMPAKHFTLFGRKIGCRCTLDHFLVASLNRAVALEQVNDIAVCITENLNLDVARALDKFLEIDLIVAKCRLGLASGGRNVVLELCGLSNHTHAAATPAPARLQHERITDFFGQPGNRGGIIGQWPRRRHDGHARLLSQRSRAYLVSEGAHDG